MLRFGRPLLRYAQGIVGLRSGDVLLASYPRSGSTWIRFFLCNLLSLTEGDGWIVDFPRLDATMPELGVSDLRAGWPYRTIPRVVKTHRPYSWIHARANAAILVTRDPRDCLVSYYHYERGRTRRRFEGELGSFLRDRRFGLEPWFRHYRSWAPRAHHTLRYEDLITEPRGTFDALLRALSVEMDDAVVAEALERSRFRNIRSLEESGRPIRQEVFRAGFRFARRGGTGDWKQHFSDADLRFYAAMHHRYGIDVYPP